MKKLLVFIIVLLLLLSACTPKDNNNNATRPTREKVAIDNNAVNRVVNGNELSGKDYIDLLKNFTVRYKNKENTVDNKEFDEFLDDIFKETLSLDYFTCHFTVIDYRKYDIEKPELSFGEVSYDDADVSGYVDQMERLQSFDYDSLSYRQQYDYEMLEYSLLETISSAKYSKYNQSFTMGGDILADIITSYDEFIFYDKEKVDDYMVLIGDVDRYINDLLEVVAKQANDGLYLTDYSINYQSSYIDSFCSKVDDNTLITSFNNRISELDFLTDDEKDDYKAQNEKIVKEEVIPAFKKVKEELSKYSGKATTETNKLVNINKEYAELQYILNTSSNMDVKELFELSSDQTDDMIAAFNTAAQKQKFVNEYSAAYYGEKEPFNLNNEETLEYLASHYQKAFPDLGEIKYNISYLDESSASDSLIAYYMQSPLDDLNQNVIRMNPNYSSDSCINRLTTIAHEGIPGHLYQHVYYYRTNPHNVRSTQGFIGSSEGYACYVEYIALHFTGLSESAIDLAFYDDFAAYLALSLIDIAVNYLDWDKAQVEEFMKNSYLNSDYAQELMDEVVDRYGVFPRYGIGFLQMLALRQYAISLLGNNFNEVEFHEVINKNGVLPFCMLKEAVNEYIYGD